MFDNTHDDTDDFDFLNESAGSAEPDITRPEDLLTPEQIEAVRFHTRRNGYDFQQVETFVAASLSSVAFFETALATVEQAYNELAEDLQHKDEQVSQLKATIEVFRAKGDPMVNASGEYITESQIKESEAYQRIQRDNETLRQQVAELTTQVGSLSSEIEELHAHTCLPPEPAVPSINEVPVVVDEVETEEAAAVEEIDVPTPPADTSNDVEPVIEEDNTARSLLRFAPEAAGVDMSAVPQERPVNTSERPDTLSDAPESAR